MIAEVPTPTEDMMQHAQYEVALKKIAKNISLDNIKFLAELSERPNINEKLETKKPLIKTFV